MIGGGCCNRIPVCGNYSAIVGGQNLSFVCPFLGRTINAFLGGGNGNKVCGSYGAIVGGASNTALGYGFVGSGSANTASGYYSGILSGFNNTSSGCLSAVIGGTSNLACACHSLAHGFCATAAGAFGGALGCCICGPDPCTYYFNNVCACGFIGGLTQFSRKTASYTLAAADIGRTIEMNVGSANNVCVPTCASVVIPIGSCISVVQYGAGQTTVCACTGVTLRSANSWTKINAQYGAITLVKVAADEWYIFGNLNA